MNKKLKIILIAIEAFVLVVLILLGIGCQQKWLIVTGDGPRFDWYAIQEDLTIDIHDAEEPDTSADPSEEDTSEPEDNGTPPASNQPVSPTPPAPETTNPEEEEPVEDPSASVPTDDWETDEF